MIYILAFVIFFVVWFLILTGQFSYIKKIWWHSYDISSTFTSRHINLILLYIIKMTLTDINLFYACNFSYTSLASVLRKNSPSKCSAMLFIQNRIRGEVIDHIEIYESAKSKTVNGLDIHTQWLHKNLHLLWRGTIFIFF